MDQFTNIDYLLHNYQKIHYFGLGFIQLKIDDTYRLHFYTDKLPPITEDIHNHRYNFTSRILKGELINQIFHAFESKNDANLYTAEYESCNPANPCPNSDKTLCSVYCTSMSTYTKGSLYWMHYNTFHRVAGTECITLLERSGYLQEYAQIVSYLGNKVCPFSQQIAESDLWEIVADMLVGVKVGVKVGDTTHAS